jgi:Tfp pilus assembly protein PilO
VNLTDRDRKILIGLIPLLVLGAFWFLLMAPKRKEAADAGAEAQKQEMRLEQAQAQADAVTDDKSDFAANYSELVRLGKAVPATVDMPSLIVQLDLAARGTGIRFSRIATGERVETPVAPAPAPATDGSQPTAAGGAPAQSGPGRATEAANTAAAASDQRSAAAESSGVAPSDAQTSTSSGGGLPVGGGATAPGAATTAGGTGAPGLETVPLELEFQGDFFDLADFFHSLKRFVRVVNNDVAVKGRLMTVDTLRFSSDPELFPKLRAELTATVYLAPKAEGVTAGATPAGPSGTGTVPTTQPTAPSGGSAPTTPTATATP